MLFFILVKCKLIKCVILKDLPPHKTLRPYTDCRWCRILNGPSVVHTSQFRTAAMLILLTESFEMRRTPMS